MTALLLPTLRRAARGGLVDAPGTRTMHRHPTPRVGGLALAAGWACAWGGLGVSGTLDGSDAWRWGVPVLGLFALGALDDVRRLSAGQKLLGQILLATLAVGLGWRWAGIGAGGVSDLPLGAATAVMTGVWIVAVVTVINFLDGIDLITVACATVWLGLGVVGGAGPGGGAFHAAALGGFVALAWWNATPAQVFPGDAATHFLGGLVAGLAVEIPGSPGAALPWPLVSAPLLPAVVEIGAGIVMKLRHGARLGQAHREHAYQRLTRVGWSHRAVALRYGVLALLAAVCVGPLASWTHALVGWSTGAGILLLHLVDVQRRTRHLPYDFGTRSPHAAAGGDGGDPTGAPGQNG